MKFLIGAILIGFCIILQPYVFISIYEWHLMDLLGLPKITWVQAYMFGAIASLYNYQYLLDIKQKDVREILIETLIKYGLILLVSFLLRGL